VSTGGDGRVFLSLLYELRAAGVPVSTQGWLAFLEALGKGAHGASLDGLYHVARCVLVQSETQYDVFDQVFGYVFKDVPYDRQVLLNDLDEWLQEPQRLMSLDPSLRAMLEELGIDELRRQFEERIAEQKERHDGGSKWIGTGGTSPFGTGGAHPSGLRVGGGGGRSALAVADARRYRAFRKDRVLDTRQMAAALRRLRRLTRKGQEEELDLDSTVRETARNCGDLEIVMRPPRKNDVRLVLLLDVGGSMDPHAQLVSRLFSAAHRGGGFREFRSYYFHNCVYGKVYEDAQFERPVPVQDLFRELDQNWYLVMVGDAWMHPGELTMTSGSFWTQARGPSGLGWLAKLADRFPHSGWLNPEPDRFWDAPSIHAIRALFRMFPLSLSGLDELVRELPKAPRPERRHLVQEVLREA
jgi:uncharacterized protein with von Willebrand factor type A (vWA) domain